MYPTYIVDNFFSDPDEVVNLANSLDFSYNIKEFPGIRTQPQHETNPHFFSWSCLKMLKVIYPNEDNITFNAAAYFHKISKDMIESGGWIHRDDTYKLTGLVFLNKKNTQGTSFFKPKTLYNPPVNIVEKQDYYMNPEKYKGTLWIQTEKDKGVAK